MNANNAVSMTEKQYNKLFNKYYRKILRKINFEIKTAIHRGEYKVTVCIDVPRINGNIIKDIRKLIKEFLETNGYYVRKYTFGLLCDEVEPEEYNISWGEESQHQRQIDNNSEKSIKQELIYYENN